MRLKLAAAFRMLDARCGRICWFVLPFSPEDDSGVVLSASAIF